MACKRCNLRFITESIREEETLNCVKCGSKIGKSDCSLLTCGNDLNIKLIQCECQICPCHHRTPNKICNKCSRGDHRGDL